LGSFGPSSSPASASKRWKNSPIRQHVVGQPPDVVDQRRLQHGRQCPQLTDRERGHGLIGYDEAREAIDLEPVVAVLDQIERDGMNARDAALLAGGELGELEVVAAWQVMQDANHFRFEQMEVVEEPLGGRRHRLAPAHVFGEHAIGRAQLTRIVDQPLKEPASTAAWCCGQGETSGQYAGARLEAVDPEKGAMRRRRAIGAHAGTRARFE
jgi:hypothetical protein